MKRILFAMLLAVATVASAQAQSHSFIVESVKITPCNANAQCWDVAPVPLPRYIGVGWGNFWIGVDTRLGQIQRPDPYIKVTVLNESGDIVATACTCTHSNTLCFESTRVLARVQEGYSVQIEVWDKDLHYDDSIGECSFSITKDDIRQGSKSLSFGQVQELRIVLRSGESAAATLERS